MSRQRSYSLRAEQGREFDAHRNGDAQISRTCLGRGFPATWRRRGHHTSYTPLPPVHSNPSSGVTLIGYGRCRIQPQLFDLDKFSQGDGRSNLEIDSSDSTGRNVDAVLLPASVSKRPPVCFAILSLHLSLEVVLVTCFR